MGFFLKVALWGALAQLLLIDRCGGNKYRANLDKYTKVFQYRTSEVEIHLPGGDGLDGAREGPQVSASHWQNSTGTPSKHGRYSFIKLGGNDFLCGVEEQGQDGGSRSAGTETLSWENMDPQIKDYLKKSKISWLMGRCFIYTKMGNLSIIHSQVDTFEVCIGTSIRYKKQIVDRETNSNVMEGQFNVVGDYKPDEDLIYPNGTIVQYYSPAIESLRGGSGSSASIEFACSYNRSGISEVVESTGNELKSTIKVLFLSPSFCDWRVDEGRNITSLDRLEALLLPLENRCQNFTDSRFWSYELCNLHAVSQFKRDAPSQELRLFNLGFHQDTARVLNETDSLDEYLSKNLISSLVNKMKPGTLTLLENTTVTIEPRNKNEPVFGDYVHEKYVATVRLLNGASCEENNKRRSIKLVFECPNGFEDFSDYFRIVNVVEDSTCSYEMLIITPVICSHPLLMPPPIAQHRKIKCLPRGLVLGRPGKDPSKIENPQKPPESEGELVNINQISSQLEAVKTEYINLILSGDMTKQFFALSTSPRTRSSGQTAPRFSVGQIVQHSWWNYYGVVIGWDWKLSAPDDWTNRVYQKYPPECKEKPHYLLLIHQQDTLFKGTSPIGHIPSDLSHSYVPELALTHVADLKSNKEFSHASAINNAFLHLYFSHWSRTHQKFVPLSNSTLLKTYPDDFNQTDIRDEL
ncbi:hypothetical protein OIY81_1375 [Cryptosporidium canis]|nr:hypothetical protein OIY81_1375 [Cryptosporidium canis]